MNCRQAAISLLRNCIRNVFSDAAHASNDPVQERGKLVR
jgi:hypothetical protein